MRYTDKKLFSLDDPQIGVQHIMDKRKPTLLLSRRELLKSTGLLTGFFAMDALRSLPAIHQQASQPSISILIPSVLHQFAQPLKQGILTHSVRIDRVVECDVRNTSFMEDFLSHHQSDGVVVFTSDFFVDKLQPLFDAHRVPLLAVNLGEDRASSRIYQTLGLWQANHALGIWTGQNLGGNAVIMGSIYDSGYDALDAFHDAYRSSGGHVHDFVLSDVDRIDWDRIPNDISVLYASYSGKQADLFWDKYHRSPISHIPVAVSPFTMLDSWGKLRAKACHAFTVTPWGRGINPFFQLGANIGQDLAQGIHSRPEARHTFTYLAVEANNHVRHHPIDLSPSSVLQQPPAIKVGWTDPFFVS